MAKLQSRLVRRQKRQNRIRRKINGTDQIPRLSVFRSAKHIYVQAVDDLGGRTLAAASTRAKDVRDQIKGYTGNKDAASIVGKSLAEQLKKLGVDRAVFDRGGNRYMGRVKALADGAREGGLQI